MLRRRLERLVMLQLETGWRNEVERKDDLNVHESVARYANNDWSKLQKASPRS